MPDGLSILICTHNRSRLLDRTLESLSQTRIVPDLNLETVVVANACTDDTPAVVARWQNRFPGSLRCIVEPTPGLSVARNRALAESAHDLVAFLDDDVFVDPGWTAALLDVYRTTPAAIVAGRVELWWEAVERPPWLTRGMEDILSALDRGPDIREFTHPEMVGANFSFRRQVIDSTGPFRTDLGRVGTSLGAGEESYFARRALAAGHRLFYCPLASVKHWVPPERVEMPYLTRASYSVARTIVVTRENNRPFSLLCTLAIGSARYVGHTLLAAASTALGLDARRRRSLIRRAIGAGQAAGAWDRLSHLNPPGTGSSRPPARTAE